MRDVDGREDVVTVDFSRPRLDIRRPKKVDCRHFRVEIDESTRQVFCSDCGYELDPFMVLMEYACNEREFASTQEEVKRLLDEKRSLLRELAELKRQRNSATSALKRVARRMVNRT